jgi:methyltransferase
LSHEDTHETLPTNQLTFTSSAQSHELKTILAGKIARAASIFCVDEIVVYDDGQNNTRGKNGFASQSPQSKDNASQEDYTALTDPDGFLIYVLSYLECPPHLRKRLFPFHPNLRGVGALPPLDIPHHIKAHEWCQYREGVTVGPVNSSKSTKAGETPRKKQKKEANSESTLSTSTLVDAGFPVAVNAEIPPDTRVTVKFDSSEPPRDFPYAKNSIEIGPGTEPVVTGEAEDPSLPRTEAGYYWGYNLRRASSLSAVFTECPFEDGYDVNIGTSERGQSIFGLLEKSNSTPLPEAVSHALVVFGGLGGLEVAAEADLELSNRGITKKNVSDLFDYFVDICPGQGSRTIRTEEAIFIALAQLRSWTEKAIQ